MKETFRSNIFETNSSTTHTLTLYNKHCNANLNQKFFDFRNKKIKIQLMSNSEWFGKTHIGFVEKYRALLTDAMISHSWCTSSYLLIFQKLNKILKEKYNTTIILDMSRINSSRFINGWEKYTDGNAKQLFNYSTIYSRLKSRKGYKVNNISLYKKLTKHNQKFNSGKPYSIRMDINVYKDKTIVDSVDNIVDFLVNDRITLKTDYD